MAWPKSRHDRQVSLPSRERLRRRSRKPPSELCDLAQPITIRHFWSSSAITCMSRRTNSVVVLLIAVASFSIAAWPLELSHAQQPRPGAQKGPGGGAPKDGPGGPTQGGDAEGGGRSPAQPHIARAR